MVVQCFAWFCAGRGYRRDDMVSTQTLDEQWDHKLEGRLQEA
jgi:hypothetical protein